MNVVFLDTDPALGSARAQGRNLDVSSLSNVGAVQLFACTAPGEVVERAIHADVIVTNKVRLGEPEFRQLPRLRLVCVLATGTDVVDVQSAAAHGIVVSNVPAYSTASAAQHAIALLLELTNSVGLHNADVHSGGWQTGAAFSYWLEPVIELEGLTMGIAGWGAIGQRVGRIALALGMRVLVHTRTPRGDGASYVPRAQLLAQSDVISLHLPLTAQTRYFIDSTALQQMKQGAFLLNVARGGLVEPEAAAQALESGRLRGIAADVLEEEPPSPAHAWLAIKGAIITPHLAWSSERARTRLLQVTEGNIRAFLSGQPANVVRF